VLTEEEAAAAAAAEVGGMELVMLASAPFHRTTVQRASMQRRWRGIWMWRGR